jgi:two-component system NtrC family sensor kinase
VREVKTSRDTIEDYAHNLEKKVEERTADLQRANEELRAAQEQLVQSEKMASVGTLAAGVAHEINNPLGSILTNAQMLLLDADESGRENLKLIEEAARRCRKIVMTLLNYTRKSAPSDVKTELLRVPIDDACNLLDIECKKDNIEIRKEYSDDLPGVQGNMTELTQVFTNMIVNAKNAILKAGRPGVIRIRVFRSGDKAVCQIEDNGCGIPEKNYRRIYDPFFTTSDVGKGTGLGLSISQEIITKHGGSVEFVSKVDEGTTFTVTFPANKI